MNATSVTKCPLCEASPAKLVLGKEADQRMQRDYYLCENCHLIFVPPKFHLSSQEQKERYDTHRNSPEDEGYVSFLERAVGPLKERLPVKAQGVDYGCGPGPAVQSMLAPEGHRVDHYDPVYFPHENLNEDSYDFVVLTEVAEHFDQPRKDFEQIHRILKKGGWLALMTQIYRPDQNFSDWWYKNDPSHICFYQEQTMDYIAEQFRWKVDYHKEHVFLFKKD